MKPTASARMRAARAGLILDEPFFGTLALKLALVEDPTCDTAWTDGLGLGYNPDYIQTLSGAQLKALLAHEVMHCAAGHPWRRTGRDNGKWNEACDRAINPLLRDTHFVLPEGALFELTPDHHGKSAEWIFDRLPHPSSPGKNATPGEGQAGNDPQPTPGPGAGGTPQPAPEGTEPTSGPKEPAPNPLGEVRDAPEQAPSEEEWKQAVQQAARTSQRGNLPGDLKRFVDQQVQPRIDWRSVLRRFVQEMSHADYSWRRPNARYLNRGLYLPALRSEEMGALPVAVDTSGSIDQVLLDAFASEITALVEDMAPRVTTVFYCDAQIRKAEEFARGEPVVFSPVGGGGTDFRPVFDALSDAEDPPVALIYLTDLAGRFPETADVPTLWVVPTGCQREVPFGEVVTAE